MNILLTGATGFLGSHILKRIAERTSYKLIVLKRSFSNTERIFKYLSNPNIQYYDIDKIDIQEIFLHNKIEAIIHVATEYGKKNPSVTKILETNLMFPIYLLENAIRNGCRVFINTDSYFNKEGLSYNYLLDYSLSKKSLLMWLKYYSNDIKIANMVLEHIFGENDNSDKFTEYMIRNVAINKVDEIDLTAGTQKRDFIYVDDVVDAYMKVLEYEEKSNQKGFVEFDIGLGSAISIKEFVETIKIVSGSNTMFNFGAIPARSDEIESSAADNKKLLEIGWKPQYSVQAGLTKVVKIYRGQDQ